jgi:hypothetical protein
MLQWLRRRRQAERLAQADAEALVRDHGAEAYREARERERDVILPDGTTHAGRTPAHWRRVALIVAKRTGHKVGLDAATRMAKDADFSPDQESRDPQPRTPSAPLRPLDELKRILSRK